MRTPLLNVRDLGVAFRRDGVWTPVVEELSFDVHAGETLAIVGESGSGKSVTSLALMRLLPERGSRIEGTVTFDGRSVLDLSETDMRGLRGNQIAMIFQEPMTSLNPAISVGRQIAEVFSIHGGMAQDAARAEVTRLLDRVRIPSPNTRFDDYPHQFSGGMRQRAMIAMAVARQPKLLIADEPTTALDVTIQAQILDLLDELQRETGMAMLFITHDMGVVAQIADQTMVMHRGRYVESAATPKLFANPQQSYTRALLSAVPRIGSMQKTKGPRPFDLIDPGTGQSTVPSRMSPSVDKATAPVLRVDGLTTRFNIRSSGLLRQRIGSVHAVENVSFELRRGETVSLVGESGSGKSTTARSILRLNAPTAGAIYYGDANIAQLSNAEMRQRRRFVQMIFQDPFASLSPRLRVGDAIAESLIVHGVATRTSAKPKVASLMRRVGLDPSMTTRFPHELSGGQRQRICIARALALEPEVIIADESVSALDVTIKAQIINLMMDLQQTLKIAYLFISHDMAVVERISHRVAVMYLGEIVEIGPREAIFERPQHPYTQRLIKSVPIPDPTLRNLRLALPGEELISPIRPPHYVPPPRQYREIGLDHLVLEWQDEWEDDGRKK